MSDGSIASCVRAWIREREREYKVASFVQQRIDIARFLERRVRIRVRETSFYSARSIHVSSASFLSFGVGRVSLSLSLPRFSSFSQSLSRFILDGCEWYERGRGRESYDGEMNNERRETDF